MQVMNSLTETFSQVTDWSLLANNEFKKRNSGCYSVQSLHY